MEMIDGMNLVSSMRIIGSMVFGFEIEGSMKRVLGMKLVGWMNSVSW